MILFHRFLIGTAILFCAGFAWWSLEASRTSGSLLLKFSLEAARNTALALSGVSMVSFNSPVF